MRKIEYIVIHESDTPNGRPHTAADIDAWHKERGFKRSAANIKKFNPTLKSIGYHYVIRVDGTVETGRALDEIPAAVVGYNTTSINICMVGRGKYTHAQWAELRALVADLKWKFGRAVSVRGHYQFDTAQGKTCPDFHVPHWVLNCMVPSPENVLEV